MDFITDGRFMFALAAFICSILLAFAFTPIVRVLAFKIGAIDVPKDNRRMHKKPIPRIGGLAIFLGSAITCLFFCNVDLRLCLVLLGALCIVVLGMLDDIKNINAFVKLIFQLAISAIPVIGGVRIQYFHIGDNYVFLGLWAIPVTIIWMVALMNAINLIDGLDGLSCGVSTISAISILAVIIIQGGEFHSALLTLILIGACLGYLPYNKNPARIFMGDTGSLFLGYSLSLISIEGMFKMHTVISMIVPLIIFALPLADTIFAIVRRVLAGKSPFSADRGHLHHRFIDMGFTQKETVKILYAICGILGLVAVFMCDKMFTDNAIPRSIAITVLALVIFVMYVQILKNPENRVNTGLVDEQAVVEAEQKKQAAAEEKTENK
ncbi:MAG: undecaprenyl/decaprenyl-phosphate alpha-N-acetylglucosaminyl 1-phosphate transferase [Clostridia bacterium]|nr:undecaprenyl/decaprenyl-phosphate alpha-N-acetylglucosaminyl 1-phosphate transferase [Clostridia bacterium]